MRGRNTAPAIACTINDHGEITKAGSFELSIICVMGEWPARRSVSITASDSLMESGRKEKGRLNINRKCLGIRT
jgi:hypothetical protein